MPSRTGRQLAALGNCAVYSGGRNCVTAAGGLSGVLNALLATAEAGEDVIVTDPTYAGLLNRVRLAGGVPRQVPFRFNPRGEWRLDRDALSATIGPGVRAILLMSSSMPSGGALDADDLALVAQLCTRHDLLLILTAPWNGCFSMRAR